MADMRDALKKAGVVSEKQLRHAKHEKRVHRKQVGLEGLEAQQQEKEKTFRREQEEKRQSDKTRASADREQKAIEEREFIYRKLVKEENLLLREAGPRRFYFELPDGLISYVETSPTLGKRLAQGDAAIVDSESILSDDFAVIPGKIAHQISSTDRNRILLWNM